MKAGFIFFFFTLIMIVPAQSQNITATKPAYLEVFAQRGDGTDARMTSEQLSVNYDNLVMKGDLDLHTCRTDDLLLRNLLDSAMNDRLNFTAVIPEGKFAFSSTDNERFSAETDLLYGEHQSHILLEFEVSNKKTSSANTFMISVTGSVLLREDLGLEKDTGLNNKVSFRFSQNVSKRTF